MSAVLYRARLADGSTKRVRVDATPAGLVVEGDRPPRQRPPEGPLRIPPLAS